MRRAALALALAALLGVASAQDASECSAEVSAAVSPVQKKLDDANSKYSELYALWQKQTAELDALKGTVGDLKSKLEASKTKAKLDFPTVAAALVELTKEGALAAWDETKAVANELREGKTTKLQAHVAATVSAFRGAASSTWAFVRRELDEHVPEPVKKQVAAGAERAHVLWKEHVTDAAWAKPVLAQAASVNAEVTKVVKNTLTSTPALAPLADPVTVQLVVYAVFALPVLLLVLLPVALLGGGKKAASAEEGGKPSGNSKKKKPAAKRA